MDGYIVNNDEDNIRKCIPNMKSSEIPRHLATAIVSKNQIAISLINNLIRENGINMTKENLMKEIYYAECMEQSRARPDSRISFFGYEQLKDKYWHLMK